MSSQDKSPQLTHLLRLSASLGPQPAPSQELRNLLQQAQSEGQDPVRLYRLAEAFRPQEWSPVPPLDDVLPSLPKNPA